MFSVYVEKQNVHDKYIKCSIPALPLNGNEFKGRDSITLEEMKGVVKNVRFNALGNENCVVTIILE